MVNQKLNEFIHYDFQKFPPIPPKSLPPSRPMKFHTHFQQSSHSFHTDTITRTSGSTDTMFTQLFAVSRYLCTSAV
ncbi:unnamed protein product [Callosobruchus maculatus]|nr:unnamed protein product [Callosobruchus maculatus]